MRFRPDKPIFQQIAENIEDQVLRGELQPEERIPAVRDLAIAIEVNPNTVVRSFLDLEQSGVIFKKRGLGYFLSSDAREKILARRKKDFLQHALPEFVRTMRLLGVSLEQLTSYYDLNKDETLTLHSTQKDDK